MIFDKPFDLEEFYSLAKLIQTILQSSEGDSYLQASLNFNSRSINNQGEKITLPKESMLLQLLIGEIKIRCLRERYFYNLYGVISFPTPEALTTLFFVFVNILNKIQNRLFILFP